MNLFRSGTFRLHSGDTADWKIDCDALTQEDLETLARLIAGSAGRFSAVEGVPTGGTRLAEALTPYRSASGPLLVVDDVYTTGASMERHRGDRAAIGIVVFARRPVTQPWIRALFTYTG